MKKILCKVCSFIWVTLTGFLYYCGDGCDWAYGTIYIYVFSISKRPPVSSWAKVLLYFSQETRSSWAAGSNSNSFCTWFQSDMLHSVDLLSKLRERQSSLMGFSIPVAFDCAEAMFLCTLTWADSLYRKEQRKPNRTKRSQHWRVGIVTAESTQRWRRQTQGFPVNKENLLFKLDFHIKIVVWFIFLPLDRFCV